MYTAFASVYDRLMADVDYTGWARFYHTLMEKYGVARGRACECACGTGSLTLPLRRAGLQMTGVDLSEEMLARAMEKARAAGLMIPFVRQDMCALALPRPVDALVCGCDGVNYLLDDDRLRAFFTRARESLKPGGALYIVIRKQQGAESAEKYLKTLYASVERISREKGYWVLCCSDQADEEQ